MNSQTQVLRPNTEASCAHCQQLVARAPRRRLSRMEQFNANFNRKLRSVFSTVDWDQVSHYMDKLT